MNDPWSDLGTPQNDTDLSAKRADPDHPLDFYRGKDFAGKFVFFLNFDAPDWKVTRSVGYAGVTIEHQALGGTRKRLILTLTKLEDFEIFKVLCLDLLDATFEQNKGDVGAQIVSRRIERWRDLLKKGRGDVLTQGQVIGLVGELLLLRDFVLPEKPLLQGVLSWRGPYGDEQDFLLSEKIIEIKTQLSTSDHSFSISSEYQLDTVSGPILMCHQTLDISAGDEGTFSLNALVALIEHDLLSEDAGAQDAFRKGMFESGYSAKPEYDQPTWKLNKRRFFEVVEAFPRITRTGLSGRIRQVRYNIDIETCSQYELDGPKAKSWVFE